MKKSKILLSTVLMKTMNKRFTLSFTRYVLSLLLLISLTVLLTTNSFAQTSWTKYVGNPILELGLPGSWDSQSIEGCSVIFDGTTYQMWYAGYDGINFRIGHATSQDGIAWAKNELNPVLDIGPESWDNKRVHMPCVLQHESTYHMWYLGSNTFIEHIGHATSVDGTNWIKDSLNPVLKLGTPGSWDDMEVFPMPGSVIFDGNNYQMWYGGLNEDSGTYAVGHAISPDGSLWAKDTLNPVMQASLPPNFDQFSVVPGTVLFDGITYQQWYSGSGTDFQYRIGFATSTDGINWSKDTINNPVLDFGLGGSWDFMQAWLGSVLLDSVENMYKMWYTGGTFYNGQIGYATSLIDGVDENSPVDLQRVFIHLKNYPNPFFSETTIEYELRQHETVKLTIYNQLGKLLFQTKKSQSQGTHLQTWNAVAYPDGIYFYKIKAGNQIAWGKMVKVR